MPARRDQSEPITVERIECALDTLALVMVRSGEEGRVYLPLYQNLEQELTKLRAEEDAMSSVLARVRRSTARTEGRP